MARRARRNFTAEFKAKVVLELISGQRSQAELCRKHQLNANSLTAWKQTFLERLPLLFGEEDQGSEERVRIAELEQLVGRQTLELEILKKASRLLTGERIRNGRSL